MADIHLTFDNGPHPDGTPYVLEVLRRRRVAATFFVLGQNLATPEGLNLARRVRDAGHRLGNHSYSHQTPLGRDPRPDAVERELGRTQQLLDQVWTGPRWFRPFGGGGALGPHLLSPAAVDWMRDAEATCVLWTAVPGDWKDAEGWVESGLEQVRGDAPQVVVLHDIAVGAMRHLDRFLGALEDEGHGFTFRVPDACLPIVAGAPRPGLERYVAPVT